MLSKIAILVLCGLGAGQAGAAGVKDGTDAGTPGKHDIYGVDVTTGPGPGSPWPADDKTITIKICMVACPPCDSQNPTSLMVQIGGAKIKVLCTGSVWSWQRMKRNETTWYSAAYPEQDWTTGPWGVPQPDGTSDNTSVCCITIQTTASDLGLPIPTGKAAYTVTSHASADGSGAAVDTASGGHTKW